MDSDVYCTYIYYVYVHLYIPTIHLPFFFCNSSKVDGETAFHQYLLNLLPFCFITLPTPSWCKIHDFSRLSTGSVPHYSLVAVSRRSRAKWTGWRVPRHFISIIGYEMSRMKGGNLRF